MKTSIDIPEVSKKLKETGALAFLADYTRGDERISAELRKYNRAGVPLVIVYPADTNKPPIVLPELLTPSIVLEALESAAGK
jgi:thiol:disulfide interchange protein DsbD